MFTSNEIAYIVSFVIVPLAGAVWILWDEGVLKWYVYRRRFKNKSPAFPNNMLSARGDGSEAGWIETILGMIGTDAHHFGLNGFKRSVRPGHPWILSGRFPSRSESGYGFCVADIDIAKQILTAPHSEAVKSVMYKEVTGITCFIHNIFTSNGHRWKHARKGVAPAFSSNHIKRMVGIAKKHLDKMIETLINPLAEQGKSFDVGEEMIALTLTIIAESAFEYHMTKEEQQLFTTNLIYCAQHYVIMNPLHKRFPWLFPTMWKTARSAKTVQQISYRIMDNYKRKHPDYKQKSNDRVYEDDTIISRIMNNPNYEHDDQRAADISIFLAAGHDTTAYTIAWTLLETFRNVPPELEQYRKKAKELPQEEWKRVEELQYIIKEGMRLQPPLAPGTVRDVSKEIVYQTDSGEKVVLPKNSMYFVNLYPLFRNPKYYDDPDKFIPGRWKNPKTEEAHIPFSIGSRNCIGQTLAKAEVDTVISVLLATYDFEVENEGHSEFLTTLKPVNARLIPRKLS